MPSWARDPEAADNRWLREAYEHRLPTIYFLGIAPSRYQALLPAFISGWDARALKARVAFGVSDQEILSPPENAPERRYALRLVKQRLHQASFREAIISAYDGPPWAFLECSTFRDRPPAWPRACAPAGE